MVLQCHPLVHTRCIAERYPQTAHARSVRQRCCSPRMCIFWRRTRRPRRPSAIPRMGQRARPQPEPEAHARIRDDNLAMFDCLRLLLRKKIGGKICSQVEADMGAVALLERERPFQRGSSALSVVFWFGPTCGCSARLIWPRLVGPWLRAGCCGSWGGDEEIEGVGVRGDS